MKLTPQKLYTILLEKYGSLDWWPVDKNYHIKNKSDTRFEVIVGAILTQNTAWSNVEKAIDNLKKNNMLDIEKIVKIDVKLLQEMIKPSGFFNQKANRLKIISKYFFENYNSNLDIFFNRPVKVVRDELLQINGIGPETADSILLYAGGKPIFVVDAYTKRLCKRLPLVTNSSYDDIQSYFECDLLKKNSEDNLIRIYNELHAMIVILAKEYCKKKNPLCDFCPIKINCLYRTI